MRLSLALIASSVALAQKESYTVVFEPASICKTEKDKAKCFAESVKAGKKFTATIWNPNEKWVDTPSCSGNKSPSRVSKLSVAGYYFTPSSVETTGTDLSKCKMELHMTDDVNLCQKKETLVKTTSKTTGKPATALTLTLKKYTEPTNKMNYFYTVKTPDSGTCAGTQHLKYVYKSSATTAFLSGAGLFALLGLSYLL